MQNNTLEGKLIIVSITLPFLFVKSIVIDVQVVREFKSRVYLLILEFIVVEANTLEVDNEVVRYLCQQTTFSHICFFLAGVTLIVWDNLTLDQFFKRLVNTFETFDLQR